MIPQFNWLCDVCGCVMSPTSGIYWVKLGFINNYKEPQLWLVLLRYGADVASAFPWVVTICNREIESTFHILGDCHFSMTLWNRLGILVALIPSFTKPLPKWLHLHGTSSYASKIIIRSLCVLFSWFECRRLSGHMDKSCFPIRGA